MTAPKPADGTVIAFDFGYRRIGVAVGERLTGTASPLTTVRSPAAGGPDWTAIDSILEEWRPRTIVVGRPRNLDDTDSAMSRAATAFAQELAQRCGAEIQLVDERLSSREATARLAEARRSGRRRRRVGRGDIDPVAAQVILETWMSGRSGPDQGDA